MIDTNFDNMAFRPKWRTSLVVYYYVVSADPTQRSIIDVILLDNVPYNEI